MIGRNGMGKTTLCNAVMGVAPPAARGSIRFAGTELLGRPSYKIAQARDRLRSAGAPPVPVALHRRAPQDDPDALDRARWTPAGVYELFPRLAERKRISATQLSGGEQQMLAIGRALLTNPRLLLMDEPSEGLAPMIVEQVIAHLPHARRRGNGDPARRTEPRRRDVGRRAAARDGGRAHRGGDDIGRARRRRRRATALPGRRAACRVRWLTLSDAERERVKHLERAAQSGSAGRRPSSSSERSTRRAASTPSSRIGSGSTASRWSSSMRGSSASLSPRRT